MPNSELPQPVTLEGIKTLAREIKVERQITHCQALEVAAQLAGFNTYAHARTVLTAAVNSEKVAGRGE